MAVGLLLFAAAPVHADYVTRLLPVMLLLGVGAGLSFPSLMTIAMSGAEPHEAGLASGLVNTSMQVGGALGLAVLATLSASRAKDVLASGASSAAAIASGLHLALVIGAGLVITAVVVGDGRPDPGAGAGPGPRRGPPSATTRRAAPTSCTPRPPERPARARGRLPALGHRRAPQSAGTGRTACPG